METPTRLTTHILKQAYAVGYFPMPDPLTGELLWYCPDPRAIIELCEFRVTKSLMRSIRNRQYVVTIDQAFDQVMHACADRAETWITEEFKTVYGALAQEGFAHSVEVWLDKRLVGGTYGVSLNGAFFAESMFHRERDASKVALYYLVEHLKAQKMELLEVQFLTAHLASLGAKTIPVSEYYDKLWSALKSKATF